ncbi:lytic polysaccharide monooxygenase auxiliary activity family 9 protein [Sphaerisporangium aureirubrum]|uniref:Lytic polysaccharide monooxygenase n=1 Tax=Sphaerisporangium aureirubrum TaxID=1544736 RepID=A0ABW1NK48_9ACTN
MTPKAKVAILAAAAVVVAGLTTLALQRSAGASGAMQTPASRTYACYVDGRASGGAKPGNPACAAAVQTGGTAPVDEWSGVLRPDGAGRTRGFIPDGKLCSGGVGKYAAYDAPRADWPATVVQPGATFEFVYGAGAPQPTGLKLYVTKNGFNPTLPLTWGDLEDQPFLTADPKPGAGEGAYRFSGTLPAKSGRHIIYSVWARPGGTETVYGCSDVIFNGPATAAPAPTLSASPLPISCSASVKMTKSWRGGFQATVTIKNTGKGVLNQWYVQWMMQMDVKMKSAWDGTLMQSGPVGMIHAPDSEPRLQPGDTATAGFQATTGATRTPKFTDISCG